MSSEQILEDLIQNFSKEQLQRFVRSKTSQFRPQDDDLSHFSKDNIYKEVEKIGEIAFGLEKCFVVAVEMAEISDKSSRNKQFELAKAIIRDHQIDAGLFAFYDSKGNFRMSLVYAVYAGTKKRYSNVRRSTFFISKHYERTNKTFKKRVGKDGDFNSLDGIKEAFSIAPVIDEFYNEYLKIYNDILKSISKNEDNQDARDFVLLFTIRIIFVGFVQQRKWLGGNERFLQAFWNEYKKNHFKKNEFYAKWIEPLFFEALNTPPGAKVAYRNNDFSVETEKALQMAPFLSGGIFQRKDVDKKGYVISDKLTDQFFEFLFSYNFVIEENTITDEDLSLNPELLGMIFERLVNKEYGAVYTPRTEVDLMCRLSLLKWIQKVNTTNIHYKDLYELFFREGGPDASEDEQKEGSFSQKQYQELWDLLGNVTVCDPAIGSGAFPVGMLHVIQQIQDEIIKHYKADNIGEPFDRKKETIEKSLYGAEVRSWAVWITQLRLWITLFIDAPDEVAKQIKPILPSLDFKIACGDSLVQTIGKKLFPVDKHADVGQGFKSRITKLKNLKNEYFYNKGPRLEEVKQEELRLFRDLLGEEINIKAKRIKLLRLSDRNEQIDFLISEAEDSDADNLFEKQIKLLEDDLEELKQQKAVIGRDNVPFVWSIEFPEIFADKDGFDIVIGNPPYVRQEDISDPLGRNLSNKEYKGLLQEIVRKDFDKYFHKKEKIDAKSDLYCYFYLRSLKLLNGRGIHTFICSNSWLDVGYGAWLQKFILTKCPIELIIDNHSKRSFVGAAVNTIISILSAPRLKKKVDKEHLVKFIAFKKSFEETVFTENLLCIEEAKKIIKNNQFRVYPIRNEELFQEGMDYGDEEIKSADTGLYIGNKWGGKYLRAPDVFYRILYMADSYLTKLCCVANVRRGFTTGANEFFYLSKEDQREWSIEQKFLMPVIKTPKECNSIRIASNRLDTKIFLCNQSKNQLKGTNALKYILWGEQLKTKGRQKQKAGIKISEIATMSSRKYWYSLGDKTPIEFLCNRFFSDRFFFCYLDDPALDDQTFYGGNLREYYEKDIQIGLQNTAIQYLFIELLGRVGLGEGVLQYAVYEMQNLLVFDSRRFFEKHSGSKQKFQKIFKKIEARKMKSIFEECGIEPKSDTPIDQQEPKPMPDRAELDKIIFDALELTEEEQKDVYRAVCQLVWNRISKAKSAKKR